MTRLHRLCRAIAPLAVVGSCPIASWARSDLQALQPMSLCRAQPISLIV
jgi:hypothetical protein